MGPGAQLATAAAKVTGLDYYWAWKPRMGEKNRKGMR